MWKHYTYLHRRATDGTVFYVGKGTAPRSPKKPIHSRAYDTYKRNHYWRNVAAKHGYTVEIFASCADDKEAQRVERELIASIGRDNLTNMTDGGDGGAGRIVSAETRAKISKNSSRPRSEAWKSAIRAARKNGGNGGVVKKGDKLPDWWRNRISTAVTGSRNSMYCKTGAAHHNSRRVIDTGSGTVYDSVLIASEAVGIKMKTLYNMLSGHRQNRTNLRFA